MAVFVSFSDESSGKTERDTFLFGGWIGPLHDWDDFFVPAWDERVLAGPPRIPYLHVTDMRSAKWREKHSITETDAESRMDQACVILDQLANLHPVRIVMNAGDVRDDFRQLKVVKNSKQFAASDFEPDYLGFLAYAWISLKYLAETHPEVEKLDFVVEEKNVVTKYIQYFHSGLPLALAALGNPELGKLAGTLIPGDKYRLPLQAADLLSWHCARRERLETMSKRDAARYRTIAYRKGIRIEFTKDMLRALKTALSRYPQPNTKSQ